MTLIKDRGSDGFKGFAFGEMHTQREAQKAISMLNAFDLNGYKLKVSLAHPRPDYYGSGFGQRDRNKRR